MDCTGCAGGAVVARDLTGSLLLPLLLAACVGDAATVPRAPGIVLEHIATSAALPLSAWESLAVLRDDRACVLDSYEVRIVCGDREWRAQVALGRKGRGPGEIQMPGPLLSMPDGGLAYADLSNDRITLYTPDLQFARHSRMRDQGVVVAPITKDSLLLIAESGVRGPMRRIHSHDLAADSVIASMPLAIDSKRLGMDSIMASPVQRMADRMILRGTDDRLIWMSTDAQSILGQIPPPTFDPGYPDSIDIEEARADLKALFGVVFERDVERIRSRRKFHYARDDFAQFDESGRLWLLTNRPTSRSETLIDLYRDTVFIGALSLPGRVVAFRLRDSLLVTMTRDVERDITGIRQRRLNWYRIRTAGTSVQNEGRVGRTPTRDGGPA